MLCLKKIACIWVLMPNFAAVIGYLLMIKTFRLLLILTLVSLTQIGKAQTATILGTVIDSTNSTPIFIATIAPVGAAGGANSDFDGKFKFALPPGTYTISAYKTGYYEKKISVTVAAGETKKLDFVLAPNARTLGTVVISDGQYEKRIGDVTVSVDVVKEYLIKNNVSTSLSDVVGRVAGVSVIDGQAQIRGGSGYAYGVGSRVLLVVDNLPLVRGDWGDINWNFVPLENAEQVEVVKSASSVLYGSSALNGVINVRTAWPTDSIPETKVQFFGGVYNTPRREIQRWWPREYTPHYTGAFFNHKSQLKKNLDLVVGGNYNILDSYMQSNNNQQFRLNAKMRVRSQKVKGLTWGVNANAMYNQYGRVIYWLDGDAGAYKPGDGVTSNERYYNITVDPNITYISPKNNRHILRFRFYNVTMVRKDNFDNASNVAYGEYQFQRRTTKEWVFTTGIAGSLGFNQSSVIGDARAKTYYGGIYAQVEKKFFDRLSIIGGVRYELNIFSAPLKVPKEGETETEVKTVNIPDFSIPVFRLGLNYAINEYNNLRGSWGQGFRSPSVVERFVSGSIGPLEFFANPTIQPERGWNAEFGYKRMLTGERFNGYFDFALFWNEYRNVTEFVFALYPVTDPNTNVTTFKPGFKNLNKTRSRIAGFEVSGNGEWIISPKQSFRFFGGYTYYYPGDLETDTTQRNVGKYLANAVKSFINPDSADVAGMLTYRMNHSLRLDLEYQVGRFKVGTTLTYNSFMNRIDDIFEFFIKGVKEYRTNNPNGIFVYDSRLIFDLKHQNSIGIVVKNMLNQEYSIRPGIMDAPRNYTIQYTHKF